MQAWEHFIIRTSKVSLCQLKFTYLITYYLYLRFYSVLRKVSSINLIHFAHITRLFCEALRISKRCTCEKLEEYFAENCHPFRHSYNADYGKTRNRERRKTRNRFGGYNWPLTDWRDYHAVCIKFCVIFRRFSVYCVC